jgi:predicted enzyme related to lactoylglutathione lyase
MLTPEPAKAREFFGKLLGWTYVEIPGWAIGCRSTVSDIGGIFDLASPSTPPGTRPLIGVMVKVDNADAIVAKATSLGGAAMPAFDIMDQGRMAVCHDPNGAEFDLWQPKRMQGFDVDSRQHGAPSWFETLTTDIDRATSFYSELFGWTPEVKQMPGYEYTVFKLADAYVAGMMPILPDMGEMRPHWGTYFTVDDVDKTTSEAAKLGATCACRSRTFPGVGRMSGITSPQGVNFYVISIRHARRIEAADQARQRRRRSSAQAGCRRDR